METAGHGEDRDGGQDTDGLHIEVVHHIHQRLDDKLRLPSPVREPTVVAPMAIKKYSMYCIEITSRSASISRREQCFALIIALSRGNGQKNSVGGRRAINKIQGEGARSIGRAPFMDSFTSGAPYGVAGAGAPGTSAPAHNAGFCHSAGPARPAYPPCGPPADPLVHQQSLSGIQSGVSLLK